MDTSLPASPATQMASEIAEQPAAARRTLDALLPEQPRLRELAAGRRRVLLVARGSSDNAAIYGRYLLEVAAGVPAGLAAPSVATHYGARLDLSDTVVVSVSQSGATAEIVETQEWARACGAATVGRDQRRGVAARRRRRRRARDPGRPRARGAGDQVLPHPARGPRRARRRAGGGAAG